MKEIIVEIAKLVKPQELIYFVIIVGLFTIIGLKEISFRKKDRQQSCDLLKLVNVINGLSNQINSITEILRFLATANREKGQSDG